MKKPSSRLLTLACIELVSCLSLFSGCSTASASHLAKAEAVLAMHSSAEGAVPEFIIPDNSAVTPLDNRLSAETGSRLPDIESESPPDPLLCFSVMPAAAVDIKYALDTTQLDDLTSLPKEEPEAKPSIADLQVQCNGPMCNAPSGGGGNYSGGNYSGGNPYAGAGRPAMRFGWRVTHPFGGRGIPIVRRFTR